RSVSVDLHHDSLLQVEISDAVSERDKVKFTVHTKTSLPRFKRAEFSVVRQHEEFIWLHDTYLENEDYAGIIMPHPLPALMPALWVAGCVVCFREYLAIFKKTVAMHEVFLQRLAAHPVLRRDHNFYVFLEYDQDLSVRGKNKKELFEGFFKNMVKTADEALIASTAGLKEVDEFFDHERTFLLEYHVRVKDASMKADRMTRSHKNVAEGYIPISSVLSSLGTQESSIVNRNFLKLAELFEKLREVDEFFDHERTFLLEYHIRVKDASMKADRMTRSHKNVAEGYIPISSVLSSLGTQESSIVNRNFLKLAELFEKLRKVEGRVASDKDLKLSDLLRYYMRDSQAAKDLLYRRARSLADYENANKVLDKARMKNKEVKQAEGHQQLCCHRFEKLSGSAKQELTDFKVRRVSAFRKNLIELTELELKHAKPSTRTLSSSNTLSSTLPTELLKPTAAQH
ncbi:UNVERIFIED_CONTAM: hypothetical protein FKN15_022587, partial [Acipenser sinensis]